MLDRREIHPQPPPFEGRIKATANFLFFSAVAVKLFIKGLIRVDFQLEALPLCRALTFGDEHRQPQQECRQYGVHHYRSC